MNLHENIQNIELRFNHVDVMLKSDMDDRISSLSPNRYAGWIKNDVVPVRFIHYPKQGGIIWFWTYKSKVFNPFGEVSESWQTEKIWKTVKSDSPKEPLFPFVDSMEIKDGIDSTIVFNNLCTERQMLDGLFGSGIYYSKRSMNKSVQWNEEVYNDMSDGVKQVGVFKEGTVVKNFDIVKRIIPAFDNDCVLDVMDTDVYETIDINLHGVIFVKRFVRRRSMEYRDAGSVCLGQTPQNRLDGPSEVNEHEIIENYANHNRTYRWASPKREDVWKYNRNVIPTKTVVDFCKRNGIVMATGHPMETPVIQSPHDQMIFVEDFLKHK